MALDPSRNVPTDWPSTTSTPVKDEQGRTIGYTQSVISLNKPNQASRNFERYSEQAFEAAQRLEEMNRIMGVQNDPEVAKGYATAERLYEQSLRARGYAQQTQYGSGPDINNLEPVSSLDEIQAAGPSVSATPAPSNSFSPTLTTKSSSNGSTAVATANAANPPPPSVETAYGYETDPTTDGTDPTTAGTGFFDSVTTAATDVGSSIGNFFGFGDDDTDVAPNTATDDGTAQTFAYVPGGPGTPIETTTTVNPDGTVNTDITVLNGGEDPALAGQEAAEQASDLDEQSLDYLDEQYGLENLVLTDDGSYRLLGSSVEYNADPQEVPKNWDDWRVRLKLGKGSTYLYNSNEPGILAPLQETNGVIFPYTPTINIQYNAEYENYDLTHSNYRGYFYRGSQVQNVNVNATFTAQDTDEANYMLASLHFLRTCTKMFYGQDLRRGMPPPLVFLEGLGEYHFNDHPCVVTAVFYNLPNDVDYIPAGVPPQGVPGNVFQQGLAKSTGHQSWSSQITRLITSQLFKGGRDGATVGAANIPTSSPQDVEQFTKIYEGKTYVPTKMDINFTLLPINTRQQVSAEFSLEEYANGKLLKKGFW